MSLEQGIETNARLNVFEGHELASVLQQANVVVSNHDGQALYLEGQSVQLDGDKVRVNASWGFDPRDPGVTNQMTQLSEAVVSVSFRPDTSTHSERLQFDIHSAQKAIGSICFTGATYQPLPLIKS